MTNQIQSIAIEKLVAHPDTPNRMSKRKFAKLVRNIEQTDRYEPLVVRPCPEKINFFQIINGHYRWQALRELDYKAVDAIVWDIDDRDADILLATLNRLGGSDVLEKKLALLSRLNNATFAGQARELAKLLPLTRTQIERLSNLKGPTAPAKKSANCFASPLVFFVNDKQQKIVKNALSFAETQKKSAKTNAARNAVALTYIAQCFIEGSE